MKLNKKQKEILKHIKSGDIYDLFTYMKYYNLVKHIKYDKQEVNNLFNQDKICKKYYYYSNLTPSKAIVKTAEQFSQQLIAKEIEAINYTPASLSLNFNCGIQKITIDGKTHEINFYDGVYVTSSFNFIIDFLSLWQYLKSQMLILEVPVEISKETIGLFFEEDTCFSNANKKDVDILNLIDYSTFSFSDKYYLDNTYSFSNAQYAICSDFLTKRIYPTPQLNIYIQNHFKTTEESTQKSALIAAWLAILVAVSLSVIQLFYQYLL